LDDSVVRLSFFILLQGICDRIPLFGFQVEQRRDHVLSAGEPLYMLEPWIDDQQLIVLIGCKALPVRQDQSKLDRRPYGLRHLQPNP